MRTKRTISTLAAATAVALAAIGPASASARTESNAVPASAKKDIVETAVAAGSFDTLAALLKQAGLVKTLKAKGPYTVFAPTDKAFSKVPKATLDALATDKAKLRSVLLYHVAKGKLTASKVVKRSSIKTLNGQRVRVRVRDGKVFVGGARVITPDELPAASRGGRVAEPYSVVFECSGRGEAAESALDQLDYAATFVFVGTSMTYPRVNHNRVIILESTILGAYNYDAAGWAPAWPTFVAAKPCRLNSGPSR